MTEPSRRAAAVASPASTLSRAVALGDEVAAALRDFVVAALGES